MSTESRAIQLVEFECKGQRLALPLECVQRAIPSAEPLPLPGAGAMVLGMLNLGGSVIAVLDVCRRLGLPDAPISPAQQILVLDLPDLRCGVVVDRIGGVSERILDGAVPEHLGAAPFVMGMVRLEDGLRLIVDPSRFLFPDEREALARALAGGVDADC